VQQGDVFGPLFFALGLDELLRAIRAHAQSTRRLHLRWPARFCVRIGDGHSC
jgi:hypothetical protein